MDDVPRTQVLTRRQALRQALGAVAGLTLACSPAAPPIPPPAPTAAPPVPTPAAPPTVVPLAPTAVPPAPIPPTAVVSPTAAPALAAARQVLATMTLEQKVGQVFMLGFEGTGLEERNRALIQGLHLGGVMLFDRNVRDPAQVARLVAELQTVADPVPLFVAADQEGGLVARIRTGATVFPGAMALGATSDPDLARQVARAQARELLAVGVNMNLAPVVDVNTNPANPVIGIRSFGSEVETVGAFGAATVRGHHDAGVSTVAKHFPGHGDTAVDSHLALPVVPHDRDRLERVELPPFQAAIAAGVDAVMTAHVYLSAIEPRPDTPATLSRAVLQGLLREQLGYQGLIVTDALDMAAITDDRSAADAAVAAFQAGADVLLVAGITLEDRARLGEGPKALLQAVRDGQVSEQRLDASVLRVLEAKARRGIFGEPSATPRPGLDVVGSAEHRALSLGALRRAVTVIRDDAGQLPIRRDARVLVVQPDHQTRSPVEEGTENGSLAVAVRGFAPRAEEVRAGRAPTSAQVASIVERARGADLVLLATYDLAQQPAHATLARALADSGRPIVGVTLRGPYDASAVPGIHTWVAAYGDRPLHLQAVAEVLFGAVEPTGTLPVRLA